MSLKDAVADAPTAELQLRRAEVQLLEDVYRYTVHRDADRHEMALSIVDEIHADAVVLFNLRRQMGRPMDYGDWLIAIDHELERRAS
jgi:hypothetical protein